MVMVMMMMAGAPVLNARTPKQSVNNKQNIKTHVKQLQKNEKLETPQKGPSF